MLISWKKFSDKMIVTYLDESKKEKRVDKIIKREKRTKENEFTCTHGNKQKKKSFYVSYIDKKWSIT